MWIIIAVLLVLGGIFIFGSPTNNTDLAINTNNTGANNNNNDTPTQTSGRVVFSVTDAAANMGNVSEVNMKVNSVDMHSTGGSWVTVSTTPRTYSLLALKASGNSELLSDMTAKVGTYDQVRLSIDSVAVKTKDGATFDAKLPAKELRINTVVVVKENSTSSVNFDFLADKSLHTTVDGKYIFAPVVKTESKSDATVTIDSKNVVTITGGKVDSSNTMGMDIDGSVKLNFQINSATKLNIGSDNIIKIGS